MGLKLEDLKVYCDECKFAPEVLLSGQPHCGAYIGNKAFSRKNRGGAEFRYCSINNISNDCQYFKER